jgi:Fe2+ transport system protein B
LTDEEIEIQKTDLEEDTGASVLVISGVAGIGVKEMLNDVFAAVEKQRRVTEEDSEERRVYRP